MTTVDVSEAEERIDALLELVTTGMEEVIITRDGCPIAKLVGCQAP